MTLTQMEQNRARQGATPGATSAPPAPPAQRPAPEKPRQPAPKQPPTAPEQNRPESNEPPARKPPTLRRRILIVLGIIAAIVVGVFGVRYWLHARQYESTDDAFIDAPIVQVSPRVSGYAQDVNVTDNQHVKQGDLLVQIDPRDQQAKLDQAEAAQAAAQSRLTEAQTQLAMSKADVAQAQAQVDAAKANAQSAHTDLQRYQSMQPGAYSPQEKTNAEAAAQAADANVAAAQSKVVAAQAAVDNAGSHVDTAKAEVAAAQTHVAQAELDLSYTKITAPTSGRVTRKSVEPGDYLQPGQAMFAIVPDEIWVWANYKETQLTDMRPGQPATITVDAYPSYTFKGHVDSIQHGTGARFSLLPPENATGNYVKVVQRVPVKIVFDQKIPDDLVLAPGMSVVPEVKVK